MKKQILKNSTTAKAVETKVEANVEAIANGNKKVVKKAPAPAKEEVVKVEETAAPTKVGKKVVTPKVEEEPKAEKEPKAETKKVVKKATEPAKVEEPKVEAKKVVKKVEAAVPAKGVKQVKPTEEHKTEASVKPTSNKKIVEAGEPIMEDGEIVSFGGIVVGDKIEHNKFGVGECVSFSTKMKMGKKSIKPVFKFTDGVERRIALSQCN